MSLAFFSIWEPQEPDVNRSSCSRTQKDTTYGRCRDDNGEGYRLGSVRGHCFDPYERPYPRDDAKVICYGALPTVRHVGIVPYRGPPTPRRAPMPPRAPTTPTAPAAATAATPTTPPPDYRLTPWWDDNLVSPAPRPKKPAGQKPPEQNPKKPQKKKDCVIC